MRIRSVVALSLSFALGFIVVLLLGSRALAQGAEAPSAAPGAVETVPAEVSSAPPAPAPVTAAAAVDDASPPAPVEVAVEVAAAPLGLPGDDLPAPATLEAPVVPSSASASLDPAPVEEPAPPASFTAFERPFALGGYASGWAGSYLAGGIGGRARWEPFAELGIEVFGEGHIVEWNAGIRHDHQVGFNLYTPIALEPWLRLRPLFGFCSVFSLVEPTDSSSPRADDVLFGAHAGLGLEVAIEAWGSFFVEAQGAVWAGHDRTQTRWTGAVEDTYAPFGTAQLIVGFAVHLGDP